MENIKLCETCEKEHDGSYGSGRFCSYNCKQKFASIRGALKGAQSTKERLREKCKCEYCGKELETKLALKKHFSSCENKKHRVIAYNNWKCTCGETFRTRSDFYKHKKASYKCKETHGNKKIEKSCPYCQRVLTTESAYKVHIKSCKNNPSRIPRPVKFTWTDEMRKKMSETMKNAHKEGRAFSWADLSKRKEHSWPEKWLIEVLKNECNLVEGVDYETEVKFHTFSLDFVFPNKKVIEIDGSQHKRSEYQKDCDKRKDTLLQEEGWSELRVDWDYCYTNSKDAIKKIIEFIG